MDGFDELFDIRTIGDLLQDGVFICDRDGIIRYVNKKNEEISGIGRDFCVGRHVDSFLSGEGHMRNVITKQLLSEADGYVSIPGLPRPGEQVLEYGSPIRAKDGRLLGAIVVDHDISQMTKLKDLLASSERQVDSLANVNLQHQALLDRMNQANSGSAVTQWNDRTMQELMTTLYTAAGTDVTILLQGETGIGKERFAREIVSHSARQDKPFIKVNCAALPASLMESELFGYTRGAFTGADAKGRLGAFELANHGTLFLDEIGEIPLEFQAKLLRAIQEKEVTRIGSSKPVPVDFRLIAATNQNLQEKVDRGLFRADLFYRLNVVPIHIPPLRERPEDIGLLLDRFLSRFNRKYKKNIRFEPQLTARLKAYSWPGNIREMENLIERWCVLYPGDAVIHWNDVSSLFRMPDQGGDFSGKTLAELMAAYQRDILRWGMQQYGSQRALASALGVHYSTISKMLHRLEAEEGAQG